MRLKIILLGIFGLPVATLATASAQNDTELVQVHSKLGITEEFSVLKTDKTVRQGSHVKYRLVVGPRNLIALLETGNYERGHKEGEWRTFVMSPYNKLSSKGSYHVGLPEGKWFYYHEPKPEVLGKAVLAGKNSETSLTIDPEDSTAVVQAKGMCSQGKKVGLWKYYDSNAKLVQAINESTNQLMYWEQPSSQPASGEVVSINHPLLYVGGKDQLLHDLYNSIDGRSLLQSDEDFLAAGQTVNTQLIISVDSLGTQIKIALAGNKMPSKYEQLLLTQLGRKETRWLPKIEHGKTLAADYRLLIVTQKFADNRIKLAITSFGE